MLSELFGGLSSGLLEVARISAPLLISGFVMKHGKQATSWLPNGMIPVANGVIGVGVGWAVTGDPQTGAQLGILAATSATGMHQVLKIGMRKLFPNTPTL